MRDPVTAYAPRRTDIPQLVRLGVRLLPTATVVGLAWAAAWAEHGSILARDWLQLAVVAALVVAAVLASGTAARPSRGALAAAAALVGLAAWAGISALWSPVPTLARDESLLTAFYAAAFATPLLTARDEAERLQSVAAVVVGAGALAAAAAAHIASAPDTSVEQAGRLAFPIDYVNGIAVLFVVGIWPAIVLVAHRGIHPLVRTVAGAAAGALGSGFLLTQSKGSAIGLAFSGIVLFAFAPRRLRLLVPTLGLAALMAYGYGPLTEPYRHAPHGYLASIHTAGRTALWLTLAGGAAALVYALVDQRVAFSARARRIAGAVVLVALLAGIGAGAAVFLHREPHPGAFAARQWNTFKHLRRAPHGSSHFVDVGSNRYDFWRVGIRYGFERHPLVGVGARGFGPLYLLHRSSREFPRRAHSIEVEVLTEQGLVGFALLAAALGIPLALGIRARRRASAVAAVAGALCWLGQASVDWSWTIPAAGLPFFALLGVAASADDRAPLRARVALPIAAAVVAVAIFAFAPPWLAARFADRGDYSAARKLDPLSADLLVQQGFATSPPDVALVQEAVRREPRRVELHYDLSIAYDRVGRRAAAARELRAAVRLDPTDPLLLGLLKRRR